MVKVDSDASSDGTELESVNEEIDTGNGHSSHERMETEPVAHVQQYDSDNCKLFIIMNSVLLS